MNADLIKALPPGRELDTLIHTRFYEKEPYPILPRYSTGTASAQELWRELSRRYQAVEITLQDCGCAVVELFANNVKIAVEAETFPLAVSRAALLALEAEKGDR